MATVAAQEQQQREFEQLQRMRIAPSEAAPEAPEPPATVAP